MLFNKNKADLQDSGKHYVKDYWQMGKNRN